MVSENLVDRLMADQQLGRFWPIAVRTETRTAIAVGMNQQYRKPFSGHVHATLDHFGVTGENRGAVVSFAESTKGDIVEVACVM